MMKNLVAVLVLLFLSTNVVRAQDDVSQKLIAALEQIQTLKDEIVELNKAKAKLEKELEQLKKGGEKKPSTKGPTLSDLFVVAAVFTGISEHVAGPDRGLTGTGVMTITARDGDTFTATNAWVLGDKDKTSGTSEIKGKIFGATPPTVANVSAEPMCR